MQVSLHPEWEAPTLFRKQFPDFAPVENDRLLEPQASLLVHALTALGAELTLFKNQQLP